MGDKGHFCDTDYADQGEICRQTPPGAMTAVAVAVFC